MQQERTAAAMTGNEARAQESPSVASAKAVEKSEPANMIVLRPQRPPTWREKMGREKDLSRA